MTDINAKDYLRQWGFYIQLVGYKRCQAIGQNPGYFNQV